MADEELTREDKITKLEEELKKYLAAERLRLSTERTFLKTVLELSMGNAEAREKSILDAAVIESAQELLGAIVVVEETEEA